MDLKSCHRIYFIGIGGIGMSAIARYLKSQGKHVSGYDKTSTTLTKKLESEDMDIHYQDRVEFLDREADLVIYTPAIPGDHRELNWYRNHGYPVIKRSEALGMISREGKAIAVAGTHGKTTTSALITQLLTYGRADFSAFLGGIMLGVQSNYIHHGHEWVVLEADEYDRSFLRLSPQIAVLLSTDPDHLDIYGDHGVMKEGFWEFVLRIERGGSLIYKDGLQVDFPENWQDELRSRGITHTSFGVTRGQAMSSNLRVEEGRYHFDFSWGAIRMEDIVLSLPGKHNVENATVALVCAFMLRLEEGDLRRGLAEFRGIFRRFERLYEDEKVVYIDDYAHHPTELRAAIDAARTLYPGRKITGIFQPHLYSRTRDFAEGFAAALDGLDETILMPIYPARELPIPGVDSRIILERMTNPKAEIIEDDAVLEKLKTGKQEVILTLGAGDIDLLRDKIKDWLTYR